MQTKVELEGVNGVKFTLAGDGAGDKGVWLATGITGLFDPTVKTVYEEPGNYPGARYLAHRVLRRDVVFKVNILNDKKDGAAFKWLRRDSEWKKAWAYDKDCRLIITTDESGVRYLKLRLAEAMDVSMEVDPETKTLAECGVVAVAQDPFWYEDDVVFSATTTQNTVFDPNALQLPWPWPQEQLPSETLTISIDAADGGVNPTDQTIWPIWQVPGSTAAPAEPYIPFLPWLGAPKSKATIWTLPDYSFEDPEYATRRVKLPALIGGLRQEGVQKIYIDGRPTGGSFKLGYGAETTANIAWNASPATVKSALEALAAIQFDDVTVTQEAKTSEIQVVTVSPGGTGGTFTLNLDGENTPAIPFNASAFEMQEALAGLTTLGWADVSVSTSDENAVQSIDVFGEPQGGTFTLTFDGQTTGTINAKASALQVYTALVGLSNIDLQDIVVTKDIFTPWSPYKVTFSPLGKYAGVDVPLITGDASQLTGGAGLAVNVSNDVKGFREYEVTFRGAASGINWPKLTGDPAGLTGSATELITVTTKTEGSRPWVLQFTNNLSGATVPTMTIDTALLTGGTPTGRVVLVTESKTFPAENATVDTDPRVEQVTSESGSPLWARMNGVRFRHPIPPYTEAKDFVINVSGTPPGQMVTLRLPRPWSRPWGLE